VNTPFFRLPALLLASETVTRFGVPVTDDDLVEGLETFSVNLILSNPRSREEGGIVFLGNLTTATVLIQDNDSEWE